MFKCILAFLSSQTSKHSNTSWTHLNELHRLTLAVLFLQLQANTWFCFHSLRHTSSTFSSFNVGTSTTPGMVRVLIHQNEFDSSHNNTTQGPRRQQDEAARRRSVNRACAKNYRRLWTTSCVRKLGDAVAPSWLQTQRQVMALLFYWYPSKHLPSYKIII